MIDPFGVRRLDAALVPTLYCRCIPERRQAAALQGVPLVALNLCFLPECFHFIN
jgi:hypothetical protein